jgi:hypothetical protein
MSYTNGLDDPSAYFQALTYTGNGTTTNNVTNTGNSNLQPDWVWIKQRSATQDHVVTDSSRDGEVASGTNLVLTPNTAEAEASSTGFGINYATNGINFDAAWAKVNASGQTYVAWQWKANGGTTSSNTDGSITSTVQANQDAGFSIVTYGGTASANTVGHGLADTPDVIIFKNRDDTNVWAVYHQSLGNNLKIVLNSIAAQDADGAFMNGTLPTSSVFSVGASVNTNGSSDNYVAYCFAEKQGYSKFGSYVGNGSTNGPNIYTGFKPAFVMIKKSNSTGQWLLFDNARDPFNKVFHQLRIITAAESTITHDIDFLSNGFKIRDIVSNDNGSGDTFIYMAFAEHPFVAGGIPTTAR